MRLTVIEPVFFRDISKEIKCNIFKILQDYPFETTKREEEYGVWLSACQDAEKHYFEMLELGCTPQEARTVLPNSLKTEVIMTTNLRELRHILNLRAAGVTGKPHPQMLEVMVPLLNELKLKMPLIFADIEPMEV